MDKYTKAFWNQKGKTSDKWESYLPAYDSLLAQLEISVETIVEIGVQNGGSLEVWAAVAPEAKKIIGIDIDPMCANLTFDDPRISVKVTDGTLEDFTRTLKDSQTQISILVDDGSHISRDVISYFSQLWQFITPGGKYIIEDLSTSYWPFYQGGLNRADTSMQFLKRLTDVINLEHWTTNNLLSDHLGDFPLESGSFGSPDFTDILSMEFRNSMCVITKRLPDEPEGIGRRQVTGVESLVEPNAKIGNGFSLSETGYLPSGSDESLGETELEKVMHLNQRLQARVADLENSGSWKLTKPLRRLVDVFSLLKGK